MLDRIVTPRLIVLVPLAAMLLNGLATLIFG
jgi:hypothetical protein